jgi:ATP-dependent DNA ligase
VSIARFVEPMLLLPASALPEGPNISYEVFKLDGNRAIAIRSDRRVRLRSRNDQDFNRR